MSFPRPYSLLLLSVIVMMPGFASAFSALDDEEMSDISGAGMTFNWQDFRFMMKPTSYIEQVGSSTGGVGNTFKRGDLRWYGANVSGTDLGTTWTESGANMVSCASQGVNGLGCPRGGAIANFAAHDNPYILRALDYAGDGSAAAAIGNGIVTFMGDTNALTSKNTVLELLAPTNQPTYRFSFWGEIEVGKSGATNQGLLKTQTIVQGNASGSILRLFQFTETGNKTFALFYHSRLKGDFRFSAGNADAACTTTACESLGTPIAFEANEGMHFRNVNAFLPLGQLFYQALTLDVPRDVSNNPITNGNFVLELKATPNTQAVYTRFYSMASDLLDSGYVTARAGLLAKTTGATPSYTVNANYDVTHGFSRWGDWYPCQGVGCANPPVTAYTAANALAGIGRNSYNSTGDGVFFQKCSLCANFNAYAYRMTAVDVRPYSGTDSRGSGTTPASATVLGYGTIERYSVTQELNDGTSTSAAVGCTAGATGTARFKCGYGGSFLSTNAQYGSSPLTNVTQLDPSNIITRSNAQGAGATTSIPVISTGIANLGDNRVEGLLINHIKFTSYGAQY